MALTDDAVHAPPASGPFAYDSFIPPSTPGASYVDPVFGETVHRLTADHVRDDIYARNMWWSSDESSYLHRSLGGTGFADYYDVIDVATGVVTHTKIPNGNLAADGGFDPRDPGTVYYLERGDIHKVTLLPGGTWRDSVYWSTPNGSNLMSLGGTLNWFDASGRYMLVRYGEEPSVRLYDRQNLGAGPYANPIDASNFVDRNSYIGITPDGKYLVGYDARPGVGLNKTGQAVSWLVNHDNRSVAETPIVFWSLCGDHGSFLSASDGRNYMVVNNCFGHPEVWRADVSNDADGLDEDGQRRLPNNRLLLTTTWADGNHISTAASGDWTFIATEDGSDEFDTGAPGSDGHVTPWHAYRQEVIAVNVITGVVRRLAHHRSRGLSHKFPLLGCDTDYHSQPRVSASWSGKVVGFASNFNHLANGLPIVDVFAIRFQPA